jgi:hypothetical protein
VLTAHGPLPSDEHVANAVRHWRASLAAWDTYVEAASACGLLNGVAGADIIARLRSINDDDFRSAMSECMACWFLAGKLGFHVTGAATTSAGRLPDLRAQKGDWDLVVEVKAPYKPLLWGDCPQLIPIDDAMHWSDREPVDS